MSKRCSIASRMTDSASNPRQTPLDVPPNPRQALAETLPKTRQTLADTLPKTLKFVGLGFWQAWWMLAMCSSSLVPIGTSVCGVDLQLGITIATDLGYLLIFLAGALALRKGLTLNHPLILPVAAAAFSLGTFLMALIPYLSSQGPQVLVLMAGGINLAIGNALLLILWGKLWSQLATGRVGRYLYLSFLFAFLLFFLVSALPHLIAMTLMVAFPVASAVILHSCKNEPRRAQAASPLDLSDAPIARILFGVLIVSVVYGMCENVIPFMANASDVQGNQTLSMVVAGVCLAALVANIFITSPVSEAHALYQPFLPLMALGLCFVVIFDPNTSWLGNGLIILGIYCLDMLIMLVSTDVAHRSGLPVCIAFGTAILAARVGTLIGSLLPRYALGIDPSALGSMGAGGIATAAQMHILDSVVVIALLMLVLVGVLLFTNSDLDLLYRSRHGQTPRRKKRILEGEVNDSRIAGIHTADSQISGMQIAETQACDLHDDDALVFQAQSPEEMLRLRCLALAKVCGLTAREVEVLELLLQGRTVQDVCDQLVIARGTAKHHVSNIYRKTGVSDRRSLHDVVNQMPLG